MSFPKLSEPGALPSWPGCGCAPPGPRHQSQAVVAAPGRCKPRVWLLRLSSLLKQLFLRSSREKAAGWLEASFGTDSDQELPTGCCCSTKTSPFLLPLFKTSASPTSPTLSYPQIPELVFIPYYFDHCLINILVYGLLFSFSDFVQNIV